MNPMIEARFDDRVLFLRGSERVIPKLADKRVSSQNERRLGASIHNPRSPT